MPAAMRAASSCVFPEPAPASTSRLDSRSVLIRWRAASSGVTALGFLLMSHQLCEWLQRRVARDLRFRTRRRVLAARVAVMTPLAGPLVRRVNEHASRNHVSQIGQHLTNVRDWLNRDPLPFLLAFCA